VDKKELDRFCANWNIQVRETPRKIRKPVPLRHLSYDLNYNNPLYHEIVTEDLDCYEVLITKNNLHALAENDKRIEELLDKSRNNEDYIKHHRRQENLEIKIRHNNPAAKKAWENYCTILNLVYHDYVNRY
jgi:hypothetical protein